jgi:hypothetical protein
MGVLSLFEAWRVSDYADSQETIAFVQAAASERVHTMPTLILRHPRLRDGADVLPPRRVDPTTTSKSSQISRINRFIWSSDRIELARETSELFATPVAPVL